MSRQPLAPSDVEPRAEHPHRCKAGHRWQHTGSTAVTCGIPAYDPISGDLPIVGSEACPVCCGRKDLLVRELHPHYCNMCDGEWEHEGQCLDSLAACCPWCFPKPDSAPMPGARRGPHFHYCSECGQNWRHATGCSAPLRAALADCTGCQNPPAESDAALLEPSPTTPSPAARSLGDRVRPLALPVGLAAGVLLSIPILLKGFSALWSPGVNDSAPVLEQRTEARRPASTPMASAPIEPGLDVAKPPAESSPAKSTPPSNLVGLLPTPHVLAPRTEARRVPVSDRLAEQRAQEARPRIPGSRKPDVPPELAIRPLAPSSGTSEDLRTVPYAPTPSAARSDLIAQSPPPVPETPPAPSESGARATPARAILPSIPGAPPFGALSGSSGLDTSLEGHPRRVNR